MEIVHGPTDYNQITENIWIGTNMCCTIHNTELLQHGFNADIDLEDTRAEEPPQINIYLWLPTLDHMAPSQDQLRTGVAALAEMVKRGLKVYVHCRNGHGRGPTLVAAYFISEGKGVEEAIGLIKAKRPSIHLQDSQMQSLHSFAQQ